jgi:hypothetical protein
MWLDKRNALLERSRRLKKNVLAITCKRIRELELRMCVLFSKLYCFSGNENPRNEIKRQFYCKCYWQRHLTQERLWLLSGELLRVLRDLLPQLLADNYIAFAVRVLRSVKVRFMGREATVTALFDAGSSVSII